LSETLSEVRLVEAGGGARHLTRRHLAPKKQDRAPTDNVRGAVS